MPLRLASRWPLLLAVIFCVYSAVLLWDAFQSNAQLKAAADARLIADSRHRAATIGDFAAELRNTSQALADLTEVHAYLTNKALGMSPRYGLNANLDAIEQRFHAEIEGHRLGDEPVLRRIAFLDADGGVLIDTGTAQGPLDLPSHPKREALLVLDTAKGLIVLAAPVVFKGEISGSVVAVSELSHLYRFLINIDKQGSYRETLLTSEGREIPVAGSSAALPPESGPLLVKLPEDRPVALSELPLTDADSALRHSIAIKTSVAGMPLALLTTMAQEEIYGRLNSPLFLYSLSLFPLLVLVAVLRMDRLQARAGKLAKQAARSDSQRQILQGQYAALSEEVRRRELVERELQHHREHLEELVTQRTAELNSLFLALPDLYFRLKRDGTILDYRSGSDADLFLPPAHFLGKRMQDVMPPEVSARVLAAFADLAAGKAQCVFEYGLSLPSGVQHYEGRLLPLDGEQLVAVVRNVSARHKLEQERERNRQEAERLARVKSEFLANMSHEIRTPLNGILGMAQVGYRESEGRSKSRQAFTMILDSGKLLLGIINDILDLSKIEAGKLSLEAVPVDLGRLVRHACDIVQGRAQAKGIALSARLSADLPALCLGDPLRIEQILLNLLSNAVKFTEQGGVVLDVGRGGEELEIAVADTGIGMSQAQLDRLFTPFEQADGSITRRFGGTGLGLAIVRRLVELMGGDIRVESNQGQGTRFVLRLPLVEAFASEDTEVSRDRAPAAAEGMRLAGLRLLVAEDAQINQLVIQEFLEHEGAQVVMVSDGRQALECIADEGIDAFDLVLMDIQMPIMDGYEATRRIHEIAPALSVIGQTAHALAEERTRCFEAGMVDHVAKPIDAEELVAAVLRHARRDLVRAIPQAAPEGKATGGAASGVDWRALEARLHARPGFSEKLAATLLKSQADTPARLRCAIDARNLVDIAFIAHKLKGIAGNISLTGLEQLAAEVETAAREGKPEAVAAAQTLVAPLNHLLAQTETFLAGRDRVASSSGSEALS